MQGNSGQGNQNGQKQGGLSWTQTPSSSSNNNQNSAKPISQVPTSAMSKPAANNNNASKNTNASSSPKKPEQRQGGAGRTASIFIAGVIVGLVIGWGWFSLPKSERVATETTGTETSTTAANSQTSTSATSGASAGATTGSASSGSTGSTVSSGSLVVSSQSAGSQVSVSNVAVSSPTWVVVFENINGKPGNALGAQMFFAGEKSGTIDLLRATTAGNTYLVGQYIDNGDHKFSKQTDTQVNNIAGAQALAEFTAR